MQKDAIAYVKACDKCKRFGNLIRQPTEKLIPMTTPWPFTQWGLDIMDYFTKWVEAEALVTITEKNVRSFVKRNIICRYDIPRVLVSNNGKQFDNDTFRDFCSQLGIKNHYSSPVRSQANGQVEATN
ncbi:uncharacterized protein LOC142632488 [Castanea sativa]|uniref:uncharacterized protein LOC142632488 n=1 Tax=Castanea sativa TaxID=21020 RepID=UPI003F64931D